MSERTPQNYSAASNEALRSNWEYAIDQFDLQLTKSPLAMTAAEMAELGNPPQELLENPDKTWAEIMTDEEILTYLKSNMAIVVRITELAKTDSFAQRALPTFVRNLTVSLEYLSQIHKLPKELD